jgi:uncharacterized Zn-finger protein
VLVKLSVFQTTSCLFPVGLEWAEADVCMRVKGRSVAGARQQNPDFGRRMKQHQCPVCLKMFSQRHQYIGHVNVHYNLAPFVCRLCHKTFPYQTSLSRHRRIHHPGATNNTDSG